LSPGTRTTAASINDDNGFLVRPSPVGNVIKQNPGAGRNPPWHFASVISAGSVAATSSASIFTHAFFFRPSAKTPSIPIAGKPVTVNAQMAAANFPTTTTGFVTAFLASSLPATPIPATIALGGFDSILDLPSFAGGLFSFLESRTDSPHRLRRLSNSSWQPASISPFE